MAVVHWGGGRKDTLLSGKDFFAHSLYPFVKDVWKEAAETHTPQGDALFWRLQNLWLLEHNGELHKLGMYDIRAQIKDLEKDFEVVEAGQLMDFGSGGGVFVKNDAPAYYALLRTEDMPDYMEFKYIFEKRDGKFPEFDNLRRDFFGMVETVKGMPFFQKLLKEGYYKITVHYMNDSMMSEYQIGRCSGGCFEGTFEKFPSLKHPFYSGKCIYVEAIREAPYSADELPIAYNTPRLMIHGFIVAPPDRILVPYYMTRAYYPVSCKLDDRSTWAVNSKGWIGWTEKEVSNNNLIDIEGNFLY